MSPLIANVAVMIAPPARVTADPTHQHALIFRVAHSATSVQATAADIPEACRDCYWRMLSLGAHVNWAWLLDEDGVSGEDAAPTLVYGQLSATGTGDPAAAGTIIDSQEKQVYCPSNARGLLFISNSAPAAPAAYFEAEISSKKLSLGSR